MPISGAPPQRKIVAWARRDRAAGIVLSIATAIALAWANVDGAGYRHAWSARQSWLRHLALQFTTRDMVNEALMALFFVVVGLEMRREMSAGELGSWRRASAPVLAAVAGMVVPALLYAAVIHNGVAGHGWGIPMATDVAFSVGALSFVASPAARRLRVFLMTLAVADDLLVIAVLVAVYSGDFAPGWVLASIGALVALAAVNASSRLPAGLAWICAPLAWCGLARAGVETALASVAIGWIGFGYRHGPRHWEQRLLPVVTLVVLPVFAIANAGVDLRHLDFGARDATAVFVAVLIARVAGKPLAIALAARTITPLRSRVGLGAAATVGFTVPLLVTRTAFGASPLADSATAALLAATVVGLVATLALVPGRASAAN